MIKKCITCKESREHYARGMCRPCYRIETGEGKSRYQKVKSDPKLAKTVKESRARWLNKVKGTEEFRRKENQRQKNHYHKSEKRRLDLKEWKKKQPIEKRRDWAKRDNEKIHFGGRETVNKVLEKFSYKCANCGMTNEEHKRKWKSRLNLHRINGKGRSKTRGEKDNSIDNLTLLCKICHQTEDQRLRFAIHQ